MIIISPLYQSDEDPKNGSEVVINLLVNQMPGSKSYEKQDRMNCFEVMVDKFQPIRGQLPIIIYIHINPQNSPKRYFMVIKESAGSVL